MTCICTLEIFIVQLIALVKSPEHILIHTFLFASAERSKTRLNNILKISWKVHTFK